MTRYRPGQVVLMSQDNGNIWVKARVNKYKPESDMYSITILKSMSTMFVDPVEIVAYHTGRSEGTVLHSRSEERRLKAYGTGHLSPAVVDSNP